VKNFILMAAMSLLLIGCSTATQITSGRDYLSRYSPEVLAQMQDHEQSGSINSQVHKIANIEPDLQFPARIGIARIERGRLSVAPQEEMQVWADLADKFGPKFGQFVPVSPLIANMVRPETSQKSQVNVINDIRRGAARQHIDYVLTYEVINTSSDTSNALSIADISIIGLFILPSRNIKVEATASAILLDVRNGYPYGTASGFADKAAIARLVYSGSTVNNLTSKAQLASVVSLGEEVEIMFQQLLIELANKS